MPKSRLFVGNTLQAALTVTDINVWNIRTVYILKCNETYPATPISAADYV